MSHRGIDPLIGPEFYPFFESGPLVLVDVGARHGFDRRWAGVAKHSRIVGFECDPQEHARLTAATAVASGAAPAAVASGSVPPVVASGFSRTADRVLYIDAALHSSRQELDFKIARRPGGSSFLEPNWEFIRQFPDAGRFETVRTIRLKTDRLDDVLQRNGIGDVDLAKLDTQGTELAILQGAERVLASQLVGLEVEVSFSPIYAGQPLFCEVDSFVRRHGFELFDIRPTYWKRTRGVRAGGPQGQLVSGDVLYFRSLPRLLELLNEAAKASAPQARAKAFHAIAVSLLYGYVDYALELVEGFFDRHLITDVERMRLIQGLSTQRPAIAWIPMFPGRELLARSVHWLYRRLKTSPTPITGGWRLGNEC